MPGTLRTAARAIRGAVRAHEKVLYYAPAATLAALTAPDRATFRVGTYADLLELGREHDYDADAVALLGPRFNQGDRLVLGERDGRVLFSGWISVGRMELPQALVGVAGDLAYAYKLFATPAARGGGLMRGFYGYVARELVPTSDGVLASVLSANEGSIGAHERVGFTRVGRFWDLRVGAFALAVTDRAVAERIGRRAAASFGD
jgi:hypothetical protein